MALVMGGKNGLIIEVLNRMATISILMYCAGKEGVSIPTECITMVLVLVIMYHSRIRTSVPYWW